MHYRQFIQLTRAWYASACLPRSDGATDDILLTLGDKLPGEIVIRWVPIGTDAVARLQVFEDSWQALSHFGDVLEGLAELSGTNPSPGRICQLLRECGIEDATPAEKPQS